MQLPPHVNSIIAELDEISVEHFEEKDADEHGGEL